MPPTLRHALARLRAAPMFTVFSIVSLAAGVAVTTAVYSVIHSLFAGGLGVADPNRVAIVTAPAGIAASGSISDLDLADLRAAQTAFVSVAGSTTIFPAVAATGQAEILAAEAVDGDYFTTLGVRASLGRLIQPADHGAAARVVVLGHELWRTRLNGDRGAIGRTVRINGQPFEIIGVAAPEYRGLNGPLRTTRLWIPLASESLLRRAGAGVAVSRDVRRLAVIGRLRAERTAADASAELSAIGARLDLAYPPRSAPGQPGAGARAWIAKPLSQIRGAGDGDDRFALMVTALVSLVLVVACTNLANLVLARGAARQGELAVRMAMGASRGRLIWEQCVESLLIAAAGLAVACGLFRALAAAMTTDFTFAVATVRATLSIQPALDTPALVIAIGAMLVALAVFGLEPAVQLARTVDLRTALARGASGVRPRLGRQRMVIRWQVAVAAGFFIVATMFIRGTLNVARHDPGIDMDRIAIASIDFEHGAWDEGRIRRTLDRVIDESRRDPAIETVAASTGLPFGLIPSLQVTVAPAASGGGADRSMAALAATPSIFATLGVPIVRGRTFEASDGASSAPVIVVSELAAKQLFGSIDAAVGSSLRVVRGDRRVLAEVVGVARDTDVRFIYVERRPLVYLPLSQHFDDAIVVTARATGRPARAVSALREALARVDPDIAIAAIGEGDAMLAGPFVLVRSLGVATLYLGGFTLLLAMVGLFGVQSHLVAHRTREIGVRLALGATARDITSMVLGDGYRPVVEGVILGLWGGLAGRLIVRSYMAIDVAVFDPWMLLLTPLPLVAAAFCACYLPALRAAAVEPTVALRAE